MKALVLCLFLLFAAPVLAGDVPIPPCTENCPTAASVEKPKPIPLEVKILLVLIKLL